MTGGYTASIVVEDIDSNNFIVGFHGQYALGGVGLEFQMVGSVWVVGSYAVG